MDLTVNGETREFREGITLSELLEEIKAPSAGIAVECNREIVPRSQHPKRVLQNGDVLEVVKMVGGG